MDSIFELADLWSETLDPQDYADFLWSLLGRMASRDADGVIRFKDDADISGSGYNGGKEKGGSKRSGKLSSSKSVDALGGSGSRRRSTSASVTAPAAAPAPAPAIPAPPRRSSAGEPSLIDDKPPVRAHESSVPRASAETCAASDGGATPTALRRPSTPCSRLSGGRSRSISADGILSASASASTIDLPGNNFRSSSREVEHRPSTSCGRLRGSSHGNASDASASAATVERPPTAVAVWELVPPGEANPLPRNLRGSALRSSGCRQRASRVPLPERGGLPEKDDRLFPTVPFEPPVVDRPATAKAFCQPTSADRPATAKPFCQPPSADRPATAKPFCQPPSADRPATAKPFSQPNAPPRGSNSNARHHELKRRSLRPLSGQSPPQPPAVRRDVPVLLETMQSTPCYSQPHTQSRLMPNRFYAAIDFAPHDLQPSVSTGRLPANMSACVGRSSFHG